MGAAARRPSGERRPPDEDPFGGMEAAARPRVRDTPSAEDRLPRRTDRGSRPDFEKKFLGIDQPALFRRHYGPGDDAFPGRSRILQRHYFDKRRKTYRQRKPFGSEKR